MMDASPADKLRPNDRHGQIPITNIMPTEESNAAARAPADFVRLDALNDELHAIRRLLSKPGACMSAPEVMDVLRMAVDRVHSQYQSLAFEMRTKAGEPVAKGNQMIVSTDFVMRLQTASGSDISCAEVGIADWSLIVDGSCARLCNIDHITIRLKVPGDVARLVVVSRRTGIVAHFVDLPIRRYQADEFVTLAGQALTFTVRGNMGVFIDTPSLETLRKAGERERYEQASNG